MSHQAPGMVGAAEVLGLAAGKWGSSQTPQSLWPWADSGPPGPFYRKGPQDTPAGTAQAATPQGRPLPEEAGGVDMPPSRRAQSGDPAGEGRRGAGPLCPGEGKGRLGPRKVA